MRRLLHRASSGANSRLKAGRRQDCLGRRQFCNSLFLSLALLLPGCGGAGSREPLFPASVAPGWTRSEVHPVEASRFPPLVRSAGIDRGWQTEYRSSDGGVARVDAYAVRSNTQGLDLVQRWRPERDNAQFYTDHFLLNVAWQGAKHDELASLVRSLPKMIEGQ